MSSADPLRSRPTRISAADYRALVGARKQPPKPRTRRNWLPKAAEAPTREFKLRLPFLPPSVNKLFSTVRDPQTGITKRVLTTQARRIRRLIGAMIRGSLDPKRLYELHVDVYLSAFTRKQDVRRVDLTNRIKFLEDCVCEALGIDDSAIFRVVMNKHDSDTEETAVRICELKRESGRDAA